MALIPDIENIIFNMETQMRYEKVLSQLKKEFKEREERIMYGTLYYEYVSYMDFVYNRVEYNVSDNSCPHHSYTFYGKFYNNVHKKFDWRKITYYYHTYGYSCGLFSTKDRNVVVYEFNEFCESKKDDVLLCFPDKNGEYNTYIEYKTL